MNVHERFGLHESKSLSRHMSLIWPYYPGQATLSESGLSQDKAGIQVFLNICFEL